MTYGQLLRSARIARGMSLRALAATLGVSCPFLCGIELDRGMALRSELQTKAAELLGIPEPELEAAKGYTRDLHAWIRGNPELIRLIRESRATGRPLKLVSPHDELLATEPTTEGA